MVVLTDAQPLLASVDAGDKTITPLVDVSSIWITVVANKRDESCLGASLVPKYAWL